MAVVGRKKPLRTGTPKGSQAYNRLNQCKNIITRIF